MLVKRDRVKEWVVWSFTSIFWTTEGNKMCLLTYWLVEMVVKKYMGSNHEKNKVPAESGGLYLVHSHS